MVWNPGSAVAEYEKFMIAFTFYLLASLCLGERGQDLEPKFSLVVRNDLTRNCSKVFMYINSFICDLQFNLYTNSKR